MGTKIYNKLPEEFKEINDPYKFKKMLREELLSKCIHN